MRIGNEMRMQDRWFNCLQTMFNYSHVVVEVEAAHQWPRVVMIQNPVAEFYLRCFQAAISCPPNGKHSQQQIKGSIL